MTDDPSKVEAAAPGDTPVDLGAPTPSEPTQPSVDDTVDFVPGEHPPAESQTGEPEAGEPATAEVEEMPAGEVDPGAETIDMDTDIGDADPGDANLDDPELDGEPDPEPEVAPAGPIEVAEEEDEEIKKDWYILKVQSNRERSIAAALQRKVAIEGLDHLFGEIMVPTEKVTEFKGGKKKIVERKLWPGYIAVEMHVNDDTWFAIRETSGIGDFTGSGGAPTPMAPHEIAKILHTEEEETDEAPKLDIKFKLGDKVKVKEGNFESFEGEVATIDEASGKVSVMISIFGRSTPVELEYWQVESL